ncbi:MAG TPA: HAD-IA family hydrolase [Jatrophihabitans sp.]|jgi:HAD superfamily hydrolase (TIGR01509 family)|uniref:HAD family hydrolase n=1 Tax=Jatrophihabitans sp. TaxID=1932789 RepID=UPI002F08652F
MKALFLDFDGLICDTESAARRSWELLYARLDHELPARVWSAMAGDSSGHVTAAADLGARLGRPVTAEELSWRAACKAELADAQPLRPGVVALLDAARERGLGLAVVSSSAAHWVRGHLARLGVLDRFGAVVTGDDVPVHKPAPDLYLHALAVTGLTAAHVVAFEDSPAGVAAATAAGLLCVGVPNGAGDPAALGAATLVVPSLAGLDLDVLAGQVVSELASGPSTTAARRASMTTVGEEQE